MTTPSPPEPLSDGDAAPALRLCHVALAVENFAGCLDFYTRLLGMYIEWQPDEDNVYLSSGSDNLALHRRTSSCGKVQRLDHIGLRVARPEQVDSWYRRLQRAGVSMKAAPRTHRDGARSFYCLDPDGTQVQILYHPPLAEK